MKFVDAPFRPSRGGHANGALLNLFFVTERSWSKQARDTRLPGGQTMDDYLVAAARDLFAGRPWCYMANKDRADLPDGARLPNTSHGLNCYQHLHQAVILSALNPAPIHAQFVRDMVGVSHDELQDSMYRANSYQAITRTSLRDPANTDRKQVLVADRTTAEWLRDIWSAPEPRLLGTDPLPAASKVGRPRVHRCEADKHKASRLGRRNKLLSHQAAMRQAMRARGSSPGGEAQARCDEIPLLIRPSLS